MVVVAGCPNSIFTPCMGWAGEQGMTDYELFSKAHWKQPELKPSILSVHDPPHQHVLLFEPMKGIRLGQHAQQDRQIKVCTISKNFHIHSLTSHKKPRVTLPLTWTWILVLCIKATSYNFFSCHALEFQSIPVEGSNDKFLAEHRHRWQVFVNFFPLNATPHEMSKHFGAALLFFFVRCAHDMSHMTGVNY